MLIKLNKLFIVCIPFSLKNYLALTHTVTKSMFTVHIYMYRSHYALKWNQTTLAINRCVVIITCNCSFHSCFPELYFKEGKFWGNMQNPCDNNTKKPHIHFVIFSFTVDKYVEFQLDRQS